MSDILKGLTGGGWAGLSAWIMPSGAVLALFWFFVYPQMALRYPAFDALGSAEKAGAWIGTSVALGLLFNALSTPMYRLLEGYSWPRYFRDRGVARQRGIVVEIQGMPDGAGWEKGLKAEKLARFPKIDQEIAPTRLGNAMRAFETYGATRFGLDSQVMWTELSSVVPNYLQQEIDRSRANVDFFVALFYLSAAFGVIALLGLMGDGNRPFLAAVAVASFLSMYLWYRMAVVSTSYWSVTVQALVNLGRMKLADELGLKIPATIDDEREMWWLVTAFVYDNDDESARKLDLYRKQTEQSHEPGASDSQDDRGLSGVAEQEQDESVEVTAVVIREL